MKRAILTILLCLSTNQAVNPSVDLGAKSTGDNPCKLVSEGDQINKEPILCIGRLREDIAVVTRDLKIWMLNNKAIKKVDGAINQLYFGTAPPVPITEEWPELPKTKEWKNLEDVPSCNLVVDRDGQYLFLDSNVTQRNSMPLGWNIDTRTARQGFHNIHQAKDRTRWISNNDLHAYYAISDANLDSEGIRIVRYSLCTYQNTIAEGLNDGNNWGAVYDDDQSHCWLVPDPQWYHLCLDGNNNIFVQKDREKCKSPSMPAKWPLYNGFVDDGHFYLFGNDAVYSFPEKAYHSSEPSTLRTINYSYFIQCSGNASIRDDGKKKSPLTIGLIIAAVLLLLICLLCCLLCLAREAMARRKKSKGKRGSKVGKGGSAAGGFFPEASARSKGLLPFAFLTGKKGKSKRMSKSKRSSRLNGPSTLSKKGVIPATKRSKGGLSAGKDITVDRKSPSGASRTKRSKALSKKATGRRISGSMSNKATERSKLKRR